MVNKYNPAGIDYAYDLVNMDWRWTHYDNYYWDNEAKPISQGYGKTLDAQGPHIVYKPTSRPVPYHPLQESETPTKEKPVLFKLFSESDTPSSYIDFANKYGHLSEPQTLRFKDPDNDNILHGESLHFWRRQQWLMKYSLQLWGWIKNDNIKKLSSVIKWDQNLPYTFNFQLGTSEDIESFLSNGPNWNKNTHLIGQAGWLSSCNEKEHERFILNGHLMGLYELRDVLKLGDVRLPAIKTLQLIINSQLHEHPSRSMLTLDNKKQDYNNQLIPSSLLASMWLQFSQYVAGEKKIKQCPICRQWSDVTNTKGSWIKHRECANWDRVTKGRKLKEIKKLLNEGLSVNEIVQHVNVEKHHVERWLEEETKKS